MSFNPKVVKFPNKVTGKLRIGNTAADYGVYGTGTVQKFELGTRYREGDRVFRYGKAGADVSGKLGAFDFTTWFAKKTVGASSIGDMYISITTDGTSGDLINAFGVKDNMVGGYFSQPDTINCQFRRIVGHDAGVSGATIKVYLDGPITRDMVDDSVVEWCPNPYGNLRNAGGTLRQVMGVPTTVIVSGSFGWFQTWGPVWVVANLIDDFSQSYDADAEFLGGGGITDFGTNAGAQRAGYIMGSRSTGDWANPPFLYLQLSP